MAHSLAGFEPRAHPFPLGIPLRWRYLTLHANVTPQQVRISCNGYVQSIKFNSIASLRKAFITAHYNTHRLLTFLNERLNNAMGNETNTRKIIARLEREGWVISHGGRHDKFDHPALPSVT
jgi:hypothetical protein